MRFQVAPYLFLSLALGLAGCEEDNVQPTGGSQDQNEYTGAKTRFAFGSCMEEDLDKDVLGQALDTNPDFFIFLGDNIYADTEDMDEMQAKYDKLAADPYFKRLKQSGIPVMATWDDHDYGANDAGLEYPMKQESKEIFLDFWGEPADSERRTREGIYTAYTYEVEGKVIQIIMLDTRWFRGELVERLDSYEGGKNDYQPTEDTSQTFLGETQWAWLEQEFMKQADLRIIGSSQQFGHSYNGYESWTLFPHEQQRMIDLIKSTKANGVLFISGDVHWGEINKRSHKGMYDLWDVTSSGINEKWFFWEDSDYRVGAVVKAFNFGYLDIEWDHADPVIRMGIVDNDPETDDVTAATTLGALQFP